MQNNVKFQIITTETINKKKYYELNVYFELTHFVTLKICLRLVQCTELKDMLS